MKMTHKNEKLKSCILLTTVLKQLNVTLHSKFPLLMTFYLHTLPYLSNSLYLLWVSLKYFESLRQRQSHRNRGQGNEGWHVMHTHPDSPQLGTAHYFLVDIAGDQSTLRSSGGSSWHMFLGLWLYMSLEFVTSLSIATIIFFLSITPVNRTHCLVHGRTSVNIRWIDGSTRGHFFPLMVKVSPFPVPSCLSS